MAATVLFWSQSCCDYLLLTWRICSSFFVVIQNKAEAPRSCDANRKSTRSGNRPIITEEHTTKSRLCIMSVIWRWTPIKRPETTTFYYYYERKQHCFLCIHHVLRWTKSKFFADPCFILSYKTMKIIEHKHEKQKMALGSQGEDFQTLFSYSRCKKQ